MTRPDSLIFDMDGTLWDAADTYVASWNAGFRKEKIDKVISREDLSYMMGWEKRKVLEHVMPDFDQQKQERIFDTINDYRAQLVPQMGGILYEGMREGLEQLASRYKLFIVSNCPENLIKQFMEWAEITHLITDEMAHGVNSKPKHYNIKLLIDRHQLKSPVYIGDTETDSIESRKAGIPFVFLSHGFGKTEDFDLRFDNFETFTEYFMKLAEKSF
jgi:phosphoglycolate phosphatase